MKTIETHARAFFKVIIFSIGSVNLVWTFFTGKIDVGRYPEVAVKYHVNTSPLTRQLPSIIMFQDGKETGRVPAILSGQVQKFTFREEEIINTFDLNR